MKIMLDAGHGYYTAGKRTVDGSMREFQFNSAVANYAKDMIEHYKNVKVYFTHDPSGKRDVPLSDRTREANRLNADVFVSIHANAFGKGWNDADGIETYVLDTKFKEAYDLAKLVQNKVVAATKNDDRGVKEANFQVLRDTEMPAILVECGFMTNREEAAELKSDSYQRKVAKAIVDALVSKYKLKRESSSKPKPAATGSTYTIKKGDTFWSIEEDLNIKHGTLEKLNPSVNPKGLSVGQKINIKDEDRYKFVTGWFREGTKGLADMEKYLKDHGWDYAKIKEKE